MGTTIGNRDVATTGSNHTAPGPPEVSLNVPTPPAGPVPTPFPCIAKSGSASSTSSALKVGGKPVVTEASVLAVERPANQTSQPTGGDVVTHAVVGKAPVTSGSGSTSADGKGVSCTGDSVALNTMTPQAEMSQQRGVLVKGGGADMSSAGGSGDKENADPKGKRAMPAQQAKQAGDASAPPARDCPAEGDPVTVSTGLVVDEATDLVLPGALPLVLRRSYSSARCRERGALGRGGWTHSLEQWIDESERAWTLRAEDGRDVAFEKIPPGGATFHLRERLVLRLSTDGVFRVESLAARQTRTFTQQPGEARARLTAIADVYGNRVELAYQNGLLSRVLDTAGREIRALHDERGRLTRLEVWAAGAMHQTVAYAYTPEGELGSVADAAGHAEGYEYDGYHRLIRKVWKNGVAFHYEYDPDTGRCVRSWGDGGIHRVELSFDFEEHTTRSSGHEEPRLYTWDDAGRVTREELPDGTVIRERTYSPEGWLLSEANGAGEATSYEYDERGQLVRRIDPAGNEQIWRYEGNLLVEYVAPDGLPTRYTHDARGMVDSVTLPGEVRFTLTRDRHGRLTHVHGPDGLVAGYGWDDQHNLVEEIDARGARTKYTYDPLGRPVTQVDALGRVTRLEIDPVGKPLRIHHPDGTITELTRDPLGKITRHKDPLGRVTEMAYSGSGVLTRLTRPDGQTWLFRYDGLERLREVSNPRRERHEYHYDRAGRIEEERTFDGRKLRYAWSKAGRLARIDRPDKTFRELGYDPLGNVVEERSPHGSIVFERDALGRLQQAVLEEYNGKIVTSFEYDALGRVTAESQGDEVIRWEIDPRGRRLARTLPNGATTRFHYDEAGALSGVDHGGHRVAIQRDALGREARRHIYSGAVDVLSVYDAMDRLVGRQAVAPGQSPGEHVSLSERAWHYDAAGHVTHVGDARWGVTDYRYDPTGELVQARRGHAQEAFDHDVAGAVERLLSTLEPADDEERWETRPGGLVSQTHAARYEYDECRRRTKKIERGPHGDEQITRYAWDCRDRLREVELPTGERIRYTYDAFGRRVRKDVIPPERRDLAAMLRLAVEQGKDALPRVRVTRWLWDGDALAAEIADDGEARIFVHEPGTLVPLLQEEQGEVFTYVNDHLGAPRELIDAGGKVAWSAATSAYGRIVEVFRDPAARPHRRPIASPFRLLGQVEDPDTGLCHTRFRVFDPRVARWLSPDPLGLFGGHTPFGFDGSPTFAADPLGLSCTRGQGDATTSPWLADKRAGVVSHLEEFRNGGSFLIPEGAYKRFMEGRDTIGDPSGQFMTTHAKMDQLLHECGGDLGTLKQRLGIPDQYWNEPIYRVDVHSPLNHDARLPSGFERGANEHFRWGGYTSGGMPEIVTDPFPSSGTSVTPTGIAPKP